MGMMEKLWVDHMHDVSPSSPYAGGVVVLVGGISACYLNIVPFLITTTILAFRWTFMILLMRVRDIT